MKRRFIATILSMVLLCTLEIPLVWGGVAQAQPAGWYDADWAYRRAVTISNPCGTEPSDFQVRVDLDSTFDFSKALSDGSDLRVTDADGVTPIPFWIEEWNSAGVTASIWVKVPTIPFGGTTIYLYYGNATATSESDGQSTFIFFDSFEDFSPAGMNAPNYLTTPTYDGFGQVVHPDIVYVPGSWNGYKYWMAMTPYPNGNPSTENPSVIASHDGISWEVPSGLTNPLVTGGSRADTDMLLVGSTMVLYYIHASGGITSVYRMASTDGITWSAPAAVLSEPVYLLSPTVLYDGGTYYTWYVRNGGCSASSSNVYMRTSSDGITWGPEQPVNISHPGYVIWHPDVQKVGSKYVMLTADYPVGSNCGNTSLYYAESTDGITWTLNTTPMLVPKPSSWDSAEIYRSSFLVEGSLFRVWYSARSTSTIWHVGYTEGELSDFLSLPTPKWDEIGGNAAATTDHPRSGDYGLRLPGGTPYSNVRKNITGKISFTAWLYDDMSFASKHLAILRMHDPNPANHMIGVGFYTGTSTTHYSYHTEGFIYTATTIPRTAGWHKLSINVKETTCDLLMDDIVVASLDVLDEANISRISLENYLGGITYFDDAYVREYCGADPVAVLGAEELPLNVEWQPPITNPEGFTLQDGTTLPLKFKLYEPSGALIIDIQNVYMTVEGPTNGDGDTEIVRWDLGEGVDSLRFDEASSQYIANFKTRNYSLVDGANYTAVVHVGSSDAVLGTVEFVLSTAKGAGRGKGR